MARTIPNRYVRSLLKLSRRSPEELQADLRQLNLPDDLFLAEAASGEGISSEDYGRLFMHLVKQLQPELTPSGSDAVVEFSTYRMMYIAMVHAGDLESALRRAAAYFQRFQASGATMHLDRAQQQCCLRFDLGRSDEPGTTEPAAQHFCMGRLDWLPGVTGRLMALVTWHRTCSWLIGNYIDLDKVAVDHRRGSDSGFPKLLDAPIDYACGEYALYFHPRYLEFPVVQSEESLSRMLATFPAELIELENLGSSLGSQIRGLIGNDFTRDMPSLQDIASRLFMTTATMHRRLKTEGTSYQQIKDAARRDAAIDYLGRGDFSLVEVSELLGFSDNSTFHRAFKKWTGLTPQQYRERHRQDCAPPPLT